MTRTRVLTIAAGIVAIALFVESLRVIGVDQIADGLAKLGWAGGIAILVIAGGRDAVRAFAWTLTIARPARLAFLPAFRARLAGEALNSLLPMGMVVGEPVKASQVGNDVPFGAAGRALAIEFACYAASLIPLFAAGIAGFALVSPPTTGVVTTLLVAVVVLLAGAVLVPHMRKRVRQTPALSPRRLALIAACEGAYQILAILEGYITLLIISPTRPTIASAVILETVSRGVTMLFKMIPMRIGVDEASASFVAGYVSLDPATGVTLALVRKLRLLFWSAVGLVLLVRRRASAVSRAIEPSVAIPALAIAMALLAAHGVSAQDLAAGVSGTVTIGQPDGTPVALPGVTVTLRCGSDEPAVTVSDAQGAFSFSVVTGTSLTCSVGAALEGFSAAARDVQIAGGAAATVNLQLGLDTLREEITVRAVSAPVDSDRSASPAIEVPASMMQTAPLARERFQDALPLVPGVVRGPDELAREARMPVERASRAHARASADVAAEVVGLGERTLRPRRGHLERVALAHLRQELRDALAQFERDTLGMVDEQPHELAAHDLGEQHLDIGLGRRQPAFDLALYRAAHVVFTSNKKAGNSPASKGTAPASDRQYCWNCYSTGGAVRVKPWRPVRGPGRCGSRAGPGAIRRPV